MNANPTNMTKRRFPMSTLSVASFFQVIPGFFCLLCLWPTTYRGCNGIACHKIVPVLERQSSHRFVLELERQSNHRIALVLSGRLYPLILTGSTWAVNRVWFFNIPRLSKKMAAMPPANPSRMDETKKAMANGHPKIPAL